MTETLSIRIDAETNPTSTLFCTISGKSAASHSSWKAGSAKP